MEQFPGRWVTLLSHCKIVRDEILLEGTAGTTLQGGSNMNQAQDGTEGVRILHNLA
jgi:hypothetical protein